MFWMDQNSFRRRQSASWSIDQRSREAAQVPDKRFRFLGAMRITRIFTVLLIILPVALILLIIFQYEPHDHVSALAEARVMEVRALPQVTSTLQEPQSNVASLEDQKGNGGYVDDQKRSAASLGLQSSSQHLNVSIDKLLDGLLAAGFDEDSCLSRDQAFIGKVPWLIMKTNNYFVPSLFLLPSFENELQKLFPDKSTVFHHLGRYLFHPTNHVWGLVKRYYQAYLARADERIGIQVRVFDEKTDKFLRATHQIIACTTKEKLLPEVDKKESAVVASANPKTKAVLVTSLTSGYYENLKSMYWEYPTVTGDVIAVHQPSHEGHQQTEKLLHNKKAWAEIYLLSLTDSLVTSAGSTFGYVAQGLGGLRPWILYKAENGTNPDPPCSWAISMEPCFHAPPFYDCKEKRGIDTGKLVPHVRHCEDVSWGLKVVDD